MLYVPNYNQKGYDTEDRLFTALDQDPGPKPNFLWKVERATPHLDLIGIDGIAHLHYPEESTLTEVPFQIKSSDHGMGVYYRRHMAAFMARVPVVVIKDHYNNDRICRTFYRTVGEAYQHRWKYDEFLAKRLAAPLDTRTRRLLRFIEYNDLVRSWHARQRAVTPP